MMLGGDVRAADVAVWRRDAVGPYTGGFRRVPPILAVEVAGKDDTREQLLEKADWYLRHGVEVVWILEPSTRTVLIKTAEGTSTVGRGERIPRHPSLPGLEIGTDDLFRQVSRR